MKLKLLTVFLTFTSSSVFAVLLASGGLTSISSKDLGVLRKGTILAVKCSPTIRTIAHAKRGATLRPVKLGVASSQFGSPNMLKGAANKGTGAAAMRSIPSTWQISNQVAFNT